MKILKKKIVFGILILTGLTLVLETLVFKSALRLFVRANTTALPECDCVASAAFTPWDIAMVGVGGLFLAGIGAGIIYFIATLWKTRRVIRNVLSSVVKTQGDVIIFQNPTNAAFSFGFFKPTIAVSENFVSEFSPAELEAILQHERHHVQNRDPLKFLILDTITYAFFFIPLLRNLVSFYRTICELQADERIANKEALGSVLLKLKAKALHVAPVPFPSFASALHKRIEKILNPACRTAFAIQEKVLIFTCFLFILVGIGLLNTNNQSISATPCVVEQTKTPCSHQYGYF